MGSYVALREVLEAYAKWEADVLDCAEAWDVESRLPRMTQALYDRWVEIQLMRDEALGLTVARSSSDAQRESST
jgi:hypothetical protein